MSIHIVTSEVHSDRTERNRHKKIPMQTAGRSMNRINGEYAILGMELMNLSRRVLGKIFTYLGLFLTGMGIIGTLAPYMQLQRSGKIQAQVLSNDIAYRQPGVFAFRLQLKWGSAEGEQRTTLTTPVHAASEEAARASYRGKHLVAGQSYEFYTDPDNPQRVQPFRGYNWATFGLFSVVGVAGIAVFLVGMSIVRKERAAR